MNDRVNERAAIVHHTSIASNQSRTLRNDRS